MLTDEQSGYSLQRIRIYLRPSAPRKCFSQRIAHRLAKQTIDVATRGCIETRVEIRRSDAYVSNSHVGRQIGVQRTEKVSVRVLPVKVK